MISFYLLGDMGSGYQEQYKVSSAIQKNILEKNIEHPFICGLGDNMYPGGCYSVDDTQFIDKFEKPYSNLSDDITMFMILGNHDYGYDNETWDSCCNNQIEYGILSEKNNKKWRMPSRYYSVVKKDKDVTIELFMIDTNISLFNHTDKEKPSERKRTKQQLQTMIRNINKSKADWKLVIGHHTWRSVAGHGNAEPELEDFLQELFTKAPFDMYICGHDHNKQFITMDIQGDTLHAIVCGTGGKKYHDDIQLHNIQGKDDIEFFSNNLGFGLCEATRDMLQFSFYDETNKLEYSTIIKS